MNSNCELTILSRENIAVPWYWRCSGFLTQHYLRGRFLEILAARNYNNVEQRWIEAGIEIELVKKVSEIIRDWCQWPNSLFIPEDRCSALIWERSVDLTFAEISMEIEYLIPGLSEEIWSEVESFSYGEFLELLQKEFFQARNSYIKLLSFNTVNISKLVRRFPSLQTNYLRKTFSGFLFVRDDQRVKKIWTQSGSDVDIAARVSGIIERLCQWPNSLFVPDDKCSVIFRDQNMKLRTVEVIKCIKHDFSLKQSLLSKIKSISYGEFINTISM